jgi:hypothetical protein
VEELTSRGFTDETLVFSDGFKTSSCLHTSHLYCPFIYIKEVKILIVVQKTGDMTFTGQVASLLNRVGLAWWVEVTTQVPQCTYYFGPFSGSKEAEVELSGYIEDLQKEGAQGIQTTVKRCQPSELTVFEETELSAPRWVQ